MIILPHHVEAPVDHGPWGTIGLMAVTLVVALVFGFPGDGGDLDALTIEYGTINPAAWVTSVFLHYGWWHLGGNLFFLWWFGLIVEGFIGWKKFVPLYIAIGAMVAALVQILMLGGEGHAAGASAAIFGTMAVAAVWAPENKVETYVGVPIGNLGLFRDVEFTVRGLVAIKVFFDFFTVVVLSFSMSGALAHLLGAGAGVGLGTWMLRKGLVDTGGWDWFSLRRGRPTTTVTRSGLLPKAKESAAEALAGVREAIEGGSAVAADARYVAARKADPAFTLPHADLLRLVEALARSNAPETAIERMEEYVALYPEPPVLLALARLLVKTKRQSRALDHLAAIDPATEGQREAKAALEAEARAAAGTSGLELE